MASAPTTKSIGEQAQIGETRQREAGWDGAHVLDSGDAFDTETDQGRYQQGEYRTEARYGRPVEHHDEDQRPYAYQGRGEVDAARVEEHVQGFRQRVGPFGFCTQQIRDLAEDDVDRYAGEKSDHDRVRYEAGVPTQLEEPGDDHHRPGDDRDEEKGVGPVRRVDAR